MHILKLSYLNFRKHFFDIRQLKTYSNGVQLIQWKLCQTAVLISSKCTLQ